MFLLGMLKTFYTCTYDILEGNICLGVKMSEVSNVGLSNAGGIKRRGIIRRDSDVWGSNVMERLIISIEVLLCLKMFF